MNANENVNEGEDKPKKLKRRDLSIDDIIFEDKLIIFNSEEMQTFLSNFEPTFDNLMSTLAPLRYSPYDKEFLTNEFIEWYAKGEHKNGVNEVVEQQMKYYKKEKSNKWFFSLMKHLPEEVKDEYLKKYIVLNYN